ncbi:MAG TPA: hypothetical protein VEA38_11675 [Terriglobales bacterium]|nr:hypothetical protein [Terriglobales bacterium]
MARKKRLKRPGKRIELVESLFSQLPDAHKTRKVFETLASAAGLDANVVRERFQALIAMLPESARQKAEAN